MIKKLQLAFLKFIWSYGKSFKSTELGNINGIKHENSIYWKKSRIIRKYFQIHEILQTRLEKHLKFLGEYGQKVQ